MRIKYITLLITGAFLLNACGGFLDKMPDNRAELDNGDKVSKLLVSAYPTATYVQMLELMTDNVTDNGPSFIFSTKSVEESYKWQEFTDNQQDTPQFLWDEFYYAIAAANHALEYIDAADSREDLRAQRGEALICRAYAHFILVNVFSQHYDEATGHMELGIPYVKEPERVVAGEYVRGTVAETYEKIYEDIEEGLPLIQDSHYKKAVIKYHFNQKAAYAFAARFNLFYGKYDKAIEYATKALGSNPEKVLRDYTPYFPLAAARDVGNAYIKSDLACNLLIMPAVSMWSYNHWGNRSYYRYIHNLDKLDEIYWGPGPWVDSEYFHPARRLFGADQFAYFPRYAPFIEYTDVISGTGYLNITDVVLSTDEALLCRAEAYIHKQDYANAAKDLIYWYNARTYPEAPELTEERIESYYAAALDILRPELNPKFRIADEKQKNFFYCLLHFRRCETLHSGMRWFDIKRFGIEISHLLYGEGEDILTKDDVRRAVQIPADVIGAGMKPNPR